MVSVISTQYDNRWLGEFVHNCPKKLLQSVAAVGLDGPASHQVTVSYAAGPHMPTRKILRHTSQMCPLFNLCWAFFLCMGSSTVTCFRIHIHSSLAPFRYIYIYMYVFICLFFAHISQRHLWERPRCGKCTAVRVEATRSPTWPHQQETCKLFLEGCGARRKNMEKNEMKKKIEIEMKKQLSLPIFGVFLCPAQ